MLLISGFRCVIEDWVGIWLRGCGGIGVSGIGWDEHGKGDHDDDALELGNDEMKA